MSVTAELAALFPDGWDQVTATVTRLAGDRELAEECAQDAFAKALLRWPLDGIPDKPLAWLVATARNRAVDHARRAQLEVAKLRQLAGEASPQSPAAGEVKAIPDDRLEMMFACAHPALAPGAQAELILAALTSLSTAEVADAFLISERAMRQRLFRAKQRLRRARTSLMPLASSAPLAPPPASALPRRLPAILQVLYVLFNAGYEGLGDGGPVRAYLLDDALAMGRLVTILLPDEPEAQGLLALMLLHHARRDAHRGDGGFISLAEQDRSRWDRAEIAWGTDLARRALAAGRPGPFQLRAAIAASHARATTVAETDWRQLALLYAELAGITPRPLAAISQALPVAMADSPEAGILLVNAGPAPYLLPPATRASLLRRTQRLAEADDAYREALDLAAPIALARAELRSG